MGRTMFRRLSMIKGEIYPDIPFCGVCRFGLADGDTERLSDVFFSSLFLFFFGSASGGPGWRYYKISLRAALDLHIQFYIYVCITTGLMENPVIYLVRGTYP